MTRSLHPPCVGSAFYTPHSAKVRGVYTVIAPAGAVFYACDSDCLVRHLESLRDGIVQSERLEPVRRRTEAVR